MGGDVPGSRECPDVNKCGHTALVTEKSMTVKDFERDYWKFTPETRGLEGPLGRCSFK